MKISTYVASILWLICSLSTAQENKSQEHKNLPLEQLTGYSQTYYFSPGCKERADKIAAFIENAVSYFRKEIAFTPKTTLFILAPQHWEQYARFPVYGMPHNLDYYRLAVASEDNPFWKSFLPSLEQLPPALVERIQNAALAAIVDGSERITKEHLTKASSRPETCLLFRGAEAK